MNAFIALGTSGVQFIPNHLIQRQNTHSHGHHHQSHGRHHQSHGHRHQPMLPVVPRGVCVHVLMDVRNMPKHIRAAPYDNCTWETVTFSSNHVVVTHDPSYPRWVHIRCNNGAGLTMSGWIGAHHVRSQ